MLLAVMTATTVLFTSCKDDKDDDEILNVPPDSIVVDGAKKLDMGDYTFSFSANKDGVFTWKVGTYTGKDSLKEYLDIVFKPVVVYDSTDRLVRVNLYEQIKEQAGKYSRSELEYILDEYYYVPSGGYDLIEKDTKAKLGTTDAIKYVCTSKVDNKDYPILTYFEQYIVYIPKTQRLLLVTMDLPMNVKDKRINEMHNILKSFRLK